jgi:azurin
MPNGDMLVTLNLSWVGRGESLTKWRGWMMKITKEGKLIPYAAGMRSPAGFGFNGTGDLFFAENQGDWISSGKITHIEEGDFATHPASLRWSGEEGSPLKHLKRNQFPDSIGSLHDFGKNIKNFKEPSVIFPHTLMGISTSDIVTIPKGFGPFEGQMLVGDQGHSKIMRAFVEKVNGKYQGACFPFLEGFSSGVLRLSWASSNTLFVGMTSRGWDATGPAPYGLQSVTWRGTTPFEIKTIRATSNGFELEFTKPVNKKLAENIGNYKITGFTYAYHKRYGSPVVDQKDCLVKKAEVSADGLTVRVFVNGLREGYVHQLDVNGVRSQNAENVLHPVAYYTLNSIPQGTQMTEDHAAHMPAKGEEVSGCGEAKSKNITALPASWTKGAEVEITIATRPGLKFDKEYFEVPEGSKVKLVFNNNDDMLHNLLITKKEKGQAVGEMALKMGLDGSQLGYVPTSSDVLFNTCIIQPEASQSIYFIAPAAGDYPYVCTYPGHYLVMKGVMRVVPKK